ncbi:hypothetical protein BZG42_08485 [Streptococcus sp. DAT741]|nr:hypothetical protein BZG42_08485 [Streptococcus sp. DAT741]
MNLIFAEEYVFSTKFNPIPLSDSALHKTTHTLYFIIFDEKCGEMRKEFMIKTDEKRMKNSIHKNTT